MKVDIMHYLAGPNRGGEWTELVDVARRRAEQVESLGFDGIWLGEHHFNAQGEDTLPNPLMLLTDLATRTTSLRLGVAAIILPIWNPIRLAEDIAMLDHFSNGRVTIALARGILAGEIRNFNIAADRGNEAQSRAIFDEYLSVLRAAWTEEKFSWHGDWVDLPAAETKWSGPAHEPYRDENGHLTSLPVIPKPVQPSGPPLYAVSQAQAGFREAARQGLGVISSHASGKKLAALNAAHREEAAMRNLGLPQGPNTAVLRDFCVAATDDKARSLIEEKVLEHFEVIKRVRGLQEWLDLGEDPTDRAIVEANGFDLLLERDFLLVGSPESVIERMVRVARESEIDHWVLSPGNFDNASVEESTRLMAEEVLPEVRRQLSSAVIA